MKKKSVLLLILSFLFIFQSLWNVAAAFCTHENVTQQSNGHFGHHVTLVSCQQQKNLHPYDVQVQHETAFHNDLQDHKDHLPSFAQILVIDVSSEIISPRSNLSLIKQTYFWQNLYRSPDLSAANPPPLLSPL